MSISMKLIKLIIGTVSVLVITLGIVGFYVISSASNENAQQALATAQKTVQSHIDAKLEACSVYAQMLEHDDELGIALAHKNVDALKSVASRIAALPGISQFTVSDMQGVVQIRGHSSKVGDTLSMNRIMVAVPLKEGRRIIGLEPGALVRLSLGAGIPVRYEGKQVGVAIIGADLSSGAFTSSLKAALGVECTIFSGDERISTTLMPDGKPGGNTRLDNDALFRQVVGQGGTVAPGIPSRARNMTPFTGPGRICPEKSEGCSLWAFPVPISRPHRIG